MFKRVSSIVLTVVMLISMLCTITVASAATALPQLVLTADDIDGKVERGQNVTVTVGISAAIDATGIEIVMPYNTDLFSAYAVTDIAEGETVSNLVGDDIRFVWATAADVQPTAFFKVKFTVKSDAEFDKYDVDAAISEFYHGEDRIAYAEGTDYIKDAEHLMLEVYCDHDYQYTKPDGTPAQAAAKHGVSCSKCAKYSAIESCEFGAASVVEPDTCDEIGVSKIACKFCEYAIEYDVDEVTDHRWAADWIQDASSEQHYQECLNGCGDKNYADCGGWSWNSVATANGSKHICADCGRQMACVWQQYAPRIGETCTTDAYTVYPCIVAGCAGSHKVIEVGTATGHTIVKDASGTTHSCSKCDLVKNVACTFDKNIQNGDSCTKDDIKECICGNRKVVTAPGYHAEAKKVIQYKAPTENASGHIQLVCTACNTKLNYGMNKTLAKGKQFNDLAANDWFKEEAIFAKAFNLMGGDGEGNFNGNGNLTRGMVVTVLGRYIWGYLEQMTEKEFNNLLSELGTPVELKDLKGDYYDRYAIALSTIGVVKGSYGNFNGDDNVTREQLAAFFVRYIDYIAPGSNATYGPASTLSDMKTISDWAKVEATRAVNVGLIAGMDGKFNPQGTATRAQMATIMERIVRAHSEYPIVDVK